MRCFLILILLLLYLSMFGSAERFNVSIVNLDLIPREVLFGNPDKTSVLLSQDGTRISYLAPVNGVLNVWVSPVDSPEAAKPVTNDTYRGIRSYDWAYTNEHIFYYQDKNGDENWHIYSVNLTSGEIKDLTPFENVQARMYTKSIKFPTEVVVDLNKRDPRFRDLYRVDINTGNITLIKNNTEEFSTFRIDDNYSVRLAQKMTTDGGEDLYKANKTSGWDVLLEIPAEDVLTTYLLGFNKTERSIYFIDSRERNTAGFYIFDLDTGNKTFLTDDDSADISDILMHHIERVPEAAAFTYERKHWKVLNESIAGDLEYLGDVADGDMEVVSRSLDDKYWIVAYVVDTGPVRYYFYDRNKKKARFLLTNRKELEGQPLSKMNPIIIKSRDGLDLISYYTLPLKSDENEDGIPEEPLPMVLLVHGGPWSRDEWGFDPLHQWLANRGYAVLSVNFRGSTGFGKNFTNSGDMEWGGKMHEDLIDSVNWAIRRGIADPKRVAIMGGSYGGYATLVGLTFAPEVFACGVDIVGVSNLITMMETIPPYWEPEFELYLTRVGDNRTEVGRAFLKERSPFFGVEKIVKPLLIAQGANDPRVKRNESDQIVQAMQKRNVPVTYLVYSDEGHGFARPENRLSFYAAAEAFLAKNLGGRFQPIGNDFNGSNMTVPIGVEFIPGLAKALNKET
ncbi:MAG: S9 family peptidase [Methanotrichaceae archaeon]|nr:S9 family peptidase [Methanotrichaceae archaeon]